MLAYAVSQVPHLIVLMISTKDKATRRGEVMNQQKNIISLFNIPSKKTKVIYTQVAERTDCISFKLSYSSLG